MKNLIVLLLLITTTLATSQNLEWAISSGGTEQDHARAIAIDSENNTYSTGYFRGTSDFDPGSGTAIHTVQGENDVFLQKLDANGNYVWSLSFGGPGVEEASQVYADAEDNIYVQGFFNGTVDFDPSSAIFELTSNGDADGFVAKFDETGSFLWAIQLGGTGRDNTIDMQETVNNDLIITGYFSDSIDLDPTSGTSILMATGGTDTYVLKLSTDGQFIWGKHLRGMTQDDSIGSSAISITQNDEIVITGYVFGTADLDPETDIVLGTSNGLGDFFVLKLSQDGNYQWANVYGSENNFELPWGIETDNTGNIYVAGNFSGTMDVDPSANTFLLETPEPIDNAFIIKYDDLGNLIWAQSYGGNEFTRIYDLALDKNQKPMMLVKYEDTVDFDYGPDEKLLTSAGSWDTAMLFLDENGAYQWAGSIGGPDGDLGLAIAADTNNNILMNGYYFEAADLDPTNGELFLTSEGSKDMFAIKITNPTLGNTDFLSETTIVAFPNPTLGDVTIALGNSFNDVQITISDITGQVLSIQYFTQQKNIAMALPNASGIYFCTISADGTTETIKLIKK